VSLLSSYQEEQYFYGLGEMMLEKNVKNKIDRTTNDEVFQRVKGKRLLLKIIKNRRHLWGGHIIRHNEFVVNILDGAISGKKAVGRP
jgi:hypothetical protein